jgi:apolipoprotein D and lipocalin family protein
LFRRRKANMGNKSPTAAPNNVPVDPQYAPTIAALDINRYQGLWYDVASIPQSYAADCVYSYAEYTIRADGFINVVNSCFDAEGHPLRQVSGKAWVPSQQAPGKLLVKFDGWFKDKVGNYWIHETDYVSYALIGSGKPEDLWILSRKPSIDPVQLQKLLKKMKDWGYHADEAVIHGRALIEALNQTRTG